MTITAGFLCRDGVILCADSQFTYGDVFKAKGRKLSSHNLAPLPAKIGFALAGNVSHAQVAIRKIVTNLQDISDPTTVNTRKIVESIEKTLHKYYKKYIWKHPKYSDGDLDFSLLMTIYTESNGASLFYSDEDAVVNVEGFEADGSGHDLFRYIVGANYVNKMEIETLLVLATHALKEVKNNDPNCGFNSEFLAFFEHNKKFSRIAEYDISHVEKYSPEVRKATFELMFLMANPSIVDQTVEDAKSRFIRSLSSLRDEYLKDKYEHMRIKELVKVLTELPDDKA